MAGAKAAVLFLGKEEWGCLGRIQGVNLSTVKVFLEEVLGGFTFIEREKVDFSDLGSERIVKINLVIIGSGWWDVVSSFFGED